MDFAPGGFTQRAKWMVPIRARLPGRKAKSARSRMIHMPRARVYLRNGPAFSRVTEIIWFCA